MPVQMLAGHVGVYLQVYSLNAFSLVSTLLGDLVPAWLPASLWPTIDAALFIPVDVGEVGPSMALNLAFARIPLASYANLSDVQVAAKMGEGLSWGFVMSGTLYCAGAQTRAATSLRSPPSMLHRVT